MEIKFTPSKALNIHSVLYPTASISVDSNDLTVGEMFDDLIIPALLAIGYQRGSINEYLREDTIEE